MSTLTDKAWESLQTGKTEFEVGVYTFNGCNVKVIQRKNPYNYTTRTGRPVTKSARYWGGRLPFLMALNRYSRTNVAERSQGLQDFQWIMSRIAIRLKERTMFSLTKE